MAICFLISAENKPGRACGQKVDSYTLTGVTTYGEPHTTEVACFLSQAVDNHLCRPAPLEGIRFLTADTVFPQLAMQINYMAAAERLINVARVHSVRVLSPGTFARACNHAVSDMDFLIRRIKNLAAMFLEADRSQLYCFPLENRHIAFVENPAFLPRTTSPLPSNANFDVPPANT